MTLNTPPKLVEFKLGALERTALRGALIQELADYVVGGTHTRRFADNLVSGLSQAQVLALRETTPRIRQVIGVASETGPNVPDSGVTRCASARFQRLRGRFAIDQLTVKGDSMENPTRDVTNTSIWIRLIVIGLAACTVAAVAAPASGQTLRRDGSKAVSFVADVSKAAGPGGLLLRRDGSKAVPFVVNPGADVGPTAADGFDWGDAAVGAAAAIGLVALGGAGLALRGRRAPRRASLRQPKATAT